MLQETKPKPNPKSLVSLEEEVAHVQLQLRDAASMGRRAAVRRCLQGSEAQRKVLQASDQRHQVGVGCGRK